MNTHNYKEYTSFYNSFPSLSNLSQSILINDWNYTTNNNETQQQHPAIKTELLKQVFHYVGRSEFGHVTAGYQYYSQITGLVSSSSQEQQHQSLQRLHNSPNIRPQPIFVIRTEHLWKDVEYIEQKLGGIGNFTHLYNKKEVHITNENRINRMKLHDGSIEVLSICCVLRDEIHAYMNILRRAINLNKYEKNPIDTWKRCNVTDWHDLQEKCQSLRLVI